MVPPDRSIPRLNPVRLTGSLAYAQTTTAVAMSVGIRQMIVRVRKDRRIVPPMVRSPRHSSPGLGGAKPRAAGYLVSAVVGSPEVTRAIELLSTRMRVLDVSSTRR